MATDENEVPKLLEVLYSEYPGYRLSAVQRLAKLAVKDTDVVRALEAVAAGDSNAQVREAALRALGRAKPRGHVYRTRAEKWIDFAIGFVGWFVVNGVPAFIISWIVYGPRLLSGPSESGDPYGIICIGPVVLLFNIVVMIVLAFRRRMMALGILAAFAVNFATLLVFGVGQASFCGVPFYFDVFPPFR